MAISASNKILASDVTTALGTKIDTAGTGLSKSGTTLALATVTTSGGTAGPTANATPAYGATFTVPKVVYDKYGRVTGHTNYTVKIPAAPTSVSSATSATTATKANNMATAAVIVAYGSACVGATITESNGQWKFTLPSGGTWKILRATRGSNHTQLAYSIGGGKTVNCGSYGADSEEGIGVIAIRVA